MTKFEFDQIMGRETSKKEFDRAMFCFHQQNLLGEKEFFDRYKNDPAGVAYDFAGQIDYFQEKLEEIKVATVEWVQGLAVDVMKKAIEFQGHYPAGTAETIKEKVRNGVELEEEEANYIEDRLE